MTPQQMIRAIRSLEARLADLELMISAIKPEPPKEKRPYNRKQPNAVIAPESECQNSPMKN